jgi:opacity protein-like surface antigen
MIVPRPRLSQKLSLALTAAISICLCTSRVYAQAAPAGIGPGSYTDLGVTGSLFNINYSQRYVEGGSVYLNANLYRKWGAEVQYQTLRYNERGGMRQTTYLAGPRYSFRRNSKGFIPWADLTAGRGEFDFPYGYAKGVYFVYAPGAGVDFSLTQSIKLRLVSIQYQKWPQFTFGDLHPYGISAGASVRIW